MKTYQIVKSPDGKQEGIKCLVCGMTSYHPKDVEELYCGNCHEFHAVLEMRRLNEREWYHKARKTLPEDILGAKFGTRNRAELILRMEIIKNAVKDILWMARRYATDRSTYAPTMFNDAYDKLRTELGDSIDPMNASDMQNTRYHDITLEHTKDHPYALDRSEGINESIKGRKFYPRKK